MFGTSRILSGGITDDTNCWFCCVGCGQVISAERIVEQNGRISHTSTTGKLNSSLSTRVGLGGHLKLGFLP